MSVALAIAVIAVFAAGCGSKGIQVARTDPTHTGAVLFSDRCSGCHSLEIVGAQGSKPKKEINSKDRTNGPNFDTRKEAQADVLYAIRNGGFSGAIMPANIVTGAEATEVADFLAKYSGKHSK